MSGKNNSKSHCSNANQNLKTDNLLIIDFSQSDSKKRSDARKKCIEYAKNLNW